MLYDLNNALKIILLGFEIDDPLLHSDGGEVDQEDLDPIIIYAKVIEELEDEEAQTCQYPFFRKRYRIEVCTLKLFLSDSSGSCQMRKMHYYPINI